MLTLLWPGFGQSTESLTAAFMLCGVKVALATSKGAQHQQRNSLVHRQLSNATVHSCCSSARFGVIAHAHSIKARMQSLITCNNPEPTVLITGTRTHKDYSNN